MRRFFYNQIKLLKVGETLAVTEDIFHHWCKVLRASVGETAIFFDGTGGEYQVTLTQIEKKTAWVSVENFDPINRALPYAVQIGLVMSRGDRMDYAIQKATEMGVTAIHLLTSERCEVRLKADQIAKKVEHWQGVAIAACEQCGLNIVPELLPPLSVEDWLSAVTLSDVAPLKLVLAVPKATYPNVLPAIQQFFSRPEPLHCHLLIGPEGGLSEQEVAQAIAADFLPWQIGERVLRTETAPVVALSALQTIYTLCGQ